MANCVTCGLSNMGIDRQPLVLIDGEWLCRDCLGRKKSKVRCVSCGNGPFTSGEHFKTVNGRYYCTECLEKMGITSKYDYVMDILKQGTGLASAGTTSFVVNANVPRPDRSGTVSEKLGGLRILLDQNLSPGEEVTVALAGNAGEALACSKDHLYILKSGLAMGSITGRKCTKLRWADISDIVIKQGALYGLIEIQNAKYPPNDANNITRAKRSDNTVTFLLSRIVEFDQALTRLRTYMNA